VNVMKWCMIFVHLFSTKTSQVNLFRNSGEIVSKLDRFRVIDMIMNDTLAYQRIDYEHENFCYIGL
jgi:hypothetical protein